MQAFSFGYFIDKIKKKRKLFVPNDSLPFALEILKENNYVVISGAPGVGKTTLAEILIWQHLEKDYELIEIGDDVNNAWNCLNEDKKQIFYFDDFLGQTTLQKALNKNEDGRIIDFIDKIKNSKNKKFILTTREYILNEAKLYYERLSNYEFEKCIIDLKQYTDKIKALILYNHLYFSGLPQEYFDDIVKNSGYLTIIRHKNYNPRIIEHLTSIKTSKITSANYYNEFINNLENPTRIWNLAFNKLNDVAKSILLSISICLGYSSHNNIQHMAQIIHEKIFKNSKFNKIQYKDGLKILNGDFIIPYEWNIAFANPSLRDFLENYFIRNELLNELVDSIYNSEQARWFYYRYIFKCNDNRLNYYFLNKIIQKDFYSCFTFSDILGNLSITLDLIIKIGDKDAVSLVKDYFNYVLEKDACYSLSASYYDDIINNCSYSIFENEPIVTDFIGKLKNALFKRNIDFSTFEDYSTLDTFIESFDDLFNDVEKIELQTNFRNKTDEIIEQLLEDCTTPTQVEELIEKLEEVDGIFEYSNLDEVYSKLDELREKEDLQSTIYEVDTWNDYSSDSNAINPDDEIRDMFGSLVS